MKESPHYPTDNITAANFKKGVKYSTWRSRGTNDWLLTFTLDGCGHVASRNADIIAKRGTVTLYHPNTPQHYFTDGKIGYWHFFWSHFQPRVMWRSWMGWTEQTKGLSTLILKDSEVIRNVSSALLDTIRFSRQHLPGNLELAYNSLERAILWINSANLHKDLDERIRKATDLLVEQLDKPFSLEKLATECSLSISRFAHLFRDQIGISPQQYHERLRLQWATELLRSSNLSVSEIATQIGYESAFYFSTRFKKAFRKSPTHYRRANHSRAARY